LLVPENTAVATDVEFNRIKIRLLLADLISSICVFLLVSAQAATKLH